MIKRLNSTLEKVNSTTGVQITIPQPTKRGLKLSRGLSLAIGMGGLALGTVCSSKVLISFGVLGSISTVATTSELKKLK